MLNLICGLEHQGSRGGSRVCEANSLPTVGDAAAEAAGKVRRAGPGRVGRWVQDRARARTSAPQPARHRAAAARTQLFAFSSRRHRLAGGRAASGGASVHSEAADDRGTCRRWPSLGSSTAVAGSWRRRRARSPGSSASRSWAQRSFLSLYGDQLDVHTSLRRRGASMCTCPRASRCASCRSSSSWALQEGRTPRRRCRALGPCVRSALQGPQALRLVERAAPLSLARFGTARRMCLSERDGPRLSS